MKVLFDRDGHKNVMFEDLGDGGRVQTNQHLIISGDEAVLLDPGGHKTYTRLLAELSGHHAPAKISHLFFSHQDPDVLGAANAWMMMTDADAYLSAEWIHFLHHFGVTASAIERFHPIPDEGMTLEVGGTPLKLIPAHFLHSPGNFQVYDPVAKVLYTGDLGVSIGAPYAEVTDFDAHRHYIEAYHRRFMATPSVLKAWARMARALAPEVLAPQHGALLAGREVVEQFIDWIDGFRCGPDELSVNCAVPA
jgi:flavorubredoxin